MALKLHNSIPKDPLHQTAVTGHYTILHIKWIQESNDMIDAIDEASSDEEFDEDDLTNGATG